MRILVLTALLATGLAGCQTMEQSQAGAGDVCQASGYREGTRAYRNCVSTHMHQDRRESDAAAGAVVAGAAAGLVGGALVAESRSYEDRGYYGRGYDGGYGRSYYGGPGYYRGCSGWGC